MKMASVPILILVFFLAGCMHTTQGRAIYISGDINITDANFSGSLVLEKLQDGEVVKSGPLEENLQSGKVEYMRVDMWSGTRFDRANRKITTTYRLRIVSDEDEIIYELLHTELEHKIYMDMGVVEI